MLFYLMTNVICFTSIGCTTNTYYNIGCFVWNYSFVTADGKQAEESGYLKDVSINNNGEPIGIQVRQ